MNKDEIERYRRLLIDSQNQTITGLLNHLRQNPHQALEPIIEEIESRPIPEWLDKVSLPHFESACRYLEQLKQIQSSLALIDTKMFGYCADCEDEIPSSRLAVTPWEQRCARCK